MMVHLPDTLAAEPALLFCIPGGGVHGGYFDLPAPFGFARAMTEAGHVVVAVDPPGTGESASPNDGFAFTADRVATLLHRALMELRGQVLGGIPMRDLTPVGVGHSAGAMLAIVQQAAFHDFQAMMLFCFGLGGLPEQLDDAHRSALAGPVPIRAQLPQLARSRFGAAYMDLPHGSSDSPAAHALRAVRAPVATVIALHSMTPGSVAAEAAQIDVPVFVAVGRNDMTGPPHLLAAAYRACPDLTLFVSSTSGHHIFTSRDSTRLFARLHAWLPHFTDRIDRAGCLLGRAPPVAAATTH